MPTVTNGTTRTRFSDLVKGYNQYEDDNGVDYCFGTVDVEGSGDVDNIGLPLIWSASADAFIEFVANADWVASTAYTVGDVVKPSTQNGFEYVALNSDTSHSAEPTWPTTPGATVTETGDQVWMCRRAYSADTSPLPNGDTIALSVGAAEGKGFNRADTTLSGTAVSMTVLFRGPATVVKDGITWGATAAADQAEFYLALENRGISVIESGTTVDPAFI